MPLHIFIPEAQRDAVVTTTIAAFRACGLEKTSSCTRTLMPTVELASMRDGVELRLEYARPEVAKRVLVALQRVHGEIAAARCEIPLGSRGEGLSASRLRVVEGELSEDDCTAEAEEILHDWADGGPVYEEDVAAQSLAAELIDRDVDAFTVQVRLEFEPRATGLSPRLQQLFDAVAAGAAHEWTRIAGKPALRIESGTDRRIAVVTDDERTQLEEALTRANREEG